MAPKKAAKKAKPANDLEPDVAVRLHGALQTGQLDPADLARAFRADAPGCEPSDKPGAACRGRRDNPNCLCGLVPAAGGFRRKGLWQKDPQAVTKLGIDPADSRREEVSCKHSMRSTLLYPGTLHNSSAVMLTTSISRNQHSCTSGVWHASNRLHALRPATVFRRAAPDAFGPCCQKHSRALGHSMHSTAAGHAGGPQQPGQHVLRERGAAVPVREPHVPAGRSRRP